MTNSISTSLPVLTTSVPNVFASTKALALPFIELFLSCPHAAKLLESERFIKPILIDIETIPRAQTQIYSENNFEKPTGVKILIPEKHLQTTEALQRLAYEIFNAQRSPQRTSLYQEAALGNVDMDSYARKSEEDELAKTQEHFELIKQCWSPWKMSSQELKTYTSNENRHPEMHFFIQEVACHTDVFRKEWIQKFQEPYCKKHPADSRSCKTKKTDLYDDIRGKSMPDAEKKKFEIERICKLFPQAHLTIKNDPSIRKIIQDNCPKALEKSSKPPKQEEL
jgi:hypothetical protein